MAPAPSKLAFREHNQFTVEPGTIARLISARYGDDSKWLDVTDKVRQLVTKEGGIALVKLTNHLMGGDPVPGTPKTLELHFIPCDIIAEGEVPLKVIVVSRGGQKTERHRMRLERPSFDDVTRAVRQWVSGEFWLQYVDDEDDCVQLGSQPEWEECVRVWEHSTQRRNGPLVLTCNTQRTGLAAPQRCTQPLSVGASSYASGADGSIRPCSDTDKAQMAGQQPIIEAVLGHLLGPHAMERLSANAVGDDQMGLLEGWLTFTPQRDHEVHPGAVPGCELDIDIAQLAKRLHHWGMTALADAEYAAAVNWFGFLTRLDPTSPIAWYHHACALGRLEEADRALESLGRALTLGFNRPLSEIREDPDLAVLHGDERFLQMVSGEPAPQELPEGPGGARLGRDKSEEKLRKQQEKAEEKRQQAELRQLEKAAKAEQRHQETEERRMRAEERAAEKRQEAEERAAEKRQRAEEKAEEKRLRAEEKQREKAERERERAEARRLQEEERQREAEQRALEQRERREAEQRAQEERERLEAEQRAQEEERREAEQRAQEERERLEAEQRAQAEERERREAEQRRAQAEREQREAEQRRADQAKRPFESELTKIDEMGLFAGEDDRERARAMLVEYNGNLDRVVAQLLP